MCSTRLFAYKPPPLYLNSEYICTIDDFQGLTYSVLPYKVMHMTVYSHITKYHEENSCLSRHSSSPRSVHSSFISPWGRRFEYKPPGLINELQLISQNSQNRHFFVYKPWGLYTSKYGTFNTSFFNNLVCHPFPRWQHHSSKMAEMLVMTSIYSDYSY